MVVAFNRGPTEATIELPVTQVASYQELLSTNTVHLEQTGDTLVLTLPALSGIVLKRQ